MNPILAEIRFLARDRALLTWVLVVFLLASIAVWAGLKEVQTQRDTIAHLLEVDEQDRISEFTRQSDWGSAAYYSFHFTYDSPSNFAFAALGLRDSAPWKHRVRILALEGQIYEQDIGNPEFALVGRFDYSFLAAFVLPIVLIFLLHDTQSSERSAGRSNLLVASNTGRFSVWVKRATLKSGAIYVAVTIPLIIGVTASGASLGILAGALAVLAAYVVFWTIVCLWVASWQRSSAYLLCSLMGIWLLLSVVAPASGRMLIDRLVPIPADADILMTQREAVNDAWDLPKEATMQPFLARHPEYSSTAEIEGPWHWKWYYAFQQVGDQVTEDLSRSYAEGRLERDRLAQLASLLTPPVLVERSFQRLADTDMKALMAYENSVRAFHAELRHFHYPGLFLEEPFETKAIERLPTYGAFIED